MPVKITVPRTGRVRAPKLTDPQLKLIGDRMVAEQKARWAKSVNADGQLAKKLSVKYAIIKQKLLHKRPVRDMWLTGATVKNFALRKAGDGRIRAENTTVKERAKAKWCNQIDQMIGFALTDAKVIFSQTQVEYDNYAKTAWIPVTGTNRRPSTLNK